MGRRILMVLDTCAVLWLAFNREKFTAKTLQKIDNAEKLYICSLSFWEIGVKVKKKKISIPVKLQKLVHLYAGNSHIDVISPDVDIVLRSLNLKWDHKDPIDRMIVATAEKYNCHIVTSDSEIKSFFLETID